LVKRLVLNLFPYFKSSPFQIWPSATSSRFISLFQKQFFSNLAKFKINVNACILCKMTKISNQVHILKAQSLTIFTKHFSINQIWLLARRKCVQSSCNVNVKRVQSSCRIVEPILK